MGAPDGAKIADLTAKATAFAPAYEPQEMLEIAKNLYKRSR